MSDLEVGDCWPTGGRLGDCFARYEPQRNSFHLTEIFFPASAYVTKLNWAPRLLRPLFGHKPMDVVNR